MRLASAQAGMLHAFNEWFALAGALRVGFYQADRWFYEQAAVRGIAYGAHGMLVFRRNLGMGIGFLSMPAKPTSEFIESDNFGTIYLSFSGGFGG
jgi:hypothetical protein